MPSIFPVLCKFIETDRYVVQGCGKRKGAFAMYLEPWHADVLTSWSCASITARRSSARGTCSTRSGSPTSWTGIEPPDHNKTLGPRNTWTSTFLCAWAAGEIFARASALALLLCM